MPSWGYARVSTTDQDLSLQLEALSGCQYVFEEKASGTNLTNRPELARLRAIMSEGDEVVITRIDRLARSMRDLQNIVHELRERRVTLRATEQPIDTGTAAGKAFLDMLGVFAEFETNLRAERQAEGIAKAKKAGIYKGRKPSIDRGAVIRLRREGIGATQIAARLGIHRDSVYRIIREQTVRSNL